MQICTIMQLGEATTCTHQSLNVTWAKELLSMQGPFIYFLFIFSIYLSVIFPGLSYKQMYRKFKKVVLGLQVNVTPSNFFRRILRSEALVFSRVCLLVKMASKTVTRSIVFKVRKQWDYFDYCCHVFNCMVKLIVRSLCFTLTDKERQRPTLRVRYSEM